MPSAAGYHRLSVPRAICEQLNKAPGDHINIEVWKDDAPRSVEMPAEFNTLLKKEKLSLQFEALSVSRRKEYRNWILSAKRHETRSRRLSKAMEILREETKASSLPPRYSRNLL
jgi:hypothetical protein